MVAPRHKQSWRIFGSVYLLILFNRFLYHCALRAARCLCVLRVTSYVQRAKHSVLYRYVICRSIVFLLYCWTVVLPDCCISWLLYRFAVLVIGLCDF